MTKRGKIFIFLSLFTLLLFLLFIVIQKDIRRSKASSVKIKENITEANNQNKKTITGSEDKRKNQPEEKQEESKKINNINIKAKGAISVKIDKNGNKQILFEKNADKRMQIASLTKLMTAVIASEFYRKDLTIKVSKEAVRQPENIGQLKVGEIMQVSDLLKIMLIESSNDAAYALSEPIGENGFVALMNLKAKDIGMKNTKYFNPTGIDSEKGLEYSNYSTPKDLATLVSYIVLNRPEIMNIISKKDYNLYLKNGVFHHKLETTNKLLGKIPEIIGGKTGWTKEAGGCLVEILKTNNKDNFIIDIILNSTNRFGDMEKIIKAEEENS